MKLQTIASGINAAAHKYVERKGEQFGAVAGVVVTEGLALSKKWRRPVLDANGQQVRSVPGATRIGNHPIEERHQEVGGPWALSKAEQMKKGTLRRDFVHGVGVGASWAPGATYRAEARFQDFFSGK